MVALYWFEKRLLTYWFIRDVLPTLTKLAVLYFGMIRWTSCHLRGMNCCRYDLAEDVQLHLDLATDPPFRPFIMRCSIIRPLARASLCSHPDNRISMIKASCTPPGSSCEPSPCPPKQPASLSDRQLGN